MEELAALYENLRDKKSRLRHLPVVVWKHLRLYSGFERVIEEESDSISERALVDLRRPIDWALRTKPTFTFEEHTTPSEPDTNRVTFYPGEAKVIDAQTELRIHVYYDER